MRNRYWSSDKNQPVIESTEKKTPEDQPTILEKPNIIEVANNRIFFYADIDRSNVLRLNKSLIDMDSSHIASSILHDESQYRTIYLHINSYGGYIFDGLAAMDQIAMCKSPVHTVVDGVAASAATFLSVKGTRRLIKKNSFMLIHQLSSMMWGKYSDFIDEMSNLDKLMSIIKKVYLEHTEIPANKLNEILKHDLYFDAKECKKYKLVDEII